FRLDARLVNVETSEIVKVESDCMQRDHLFDIIRTVAARLMKDTNLPPLPRQASDQRSNRQIPTEALTFYSKALLFQDRGQKDKAAEMYQRTLAVFPVDVLRAFVDAGGAVVALGRDGEPDLPGEMPSELLSGFVRPPVGPRQLLVAVRAGYREAAARMETARARSEAANRSREIGELTRIGVALGTERDLKTLLELILTQARRITTSDAGSLYLVETGDQGQKRLRFRITQTYSKPDAPFVEFTIPVDRSSLAGYTAVTGEPLVIDDAYFLPPDVEYSINRSFDERHGYRTKSMLVLPMKDHKEEVIGVLQLINRKRHPEAML